MSRLAGRATTTFLFLGTLSLVGNTGSIMNSCGPLEFSDAAEHAVRDPEPVAIVHALQALLTARPAARPCDFWHDRASDFEGISIANRARIQRFGEVMHFTNFSTAAERRAAANDAIEDLRIANSNLCAADWIDFLEKIEGVLGRANP